MKLLLRGFGQSHAHTGLAIRKLGKHLFECQTELAWRLIFDFADDLYEVQHYLRAKR